MRKIFHLSAKLIVNDSDIDKAFRSIYESVMMKKGLLTRSWNMVLRFLSFNIVGNNNIRKWR